ncbi:MAG: metallophosphoesterase [Pirellulaceae bacterium]
MAWPSLLDIGLEGKLTIREERLSLRRDACRVVYVSDIHLRPNHSELLSSRIIESVRPCAADIILLGGDLVDRASELRRLEYLVGTLRQMAPVYAIGGNHDATVGLERVRDAVVQGGGDWIHHRVIQLAHGPRVVSISGPEASLRTAGDVRILCAHNPRIWKKVRDRGFDLVLAGHLHGCQFVAFQYRGRLFPGAWFYPYCYLNHQFAMTRLVVSRGASDLVPVRWRCPREIVLCHV